MNYAAILAGGVGNRMKSASIPKQFLEIAGCPIIIRTVKRIQESGLFDKIIIAAHPDWISFTEELLDKWSVDRTSVQVIAGGAERLDTISNCIKAAGSINDDDKILIHDAVRPFIQDKIMKDSLDALDSVPAVVAAVPATDTMLWIEEGNRVDKMPARSKLFHGQAPDSFKLKVLKESLESLTEEDRKVITGTAQICLVKGIPIHTVEGDPMNIKLTTDSDLVIAEAIIKILENR